MKSVCLSVLTILAILIGGCTSGESQFRKGYDFTSVDTIAVIDVLGAMPNEAAKNQVSDFFIRELLAKGYSPIERAQVHSLLKEHDFQMSDLTSDRGVAKAGQILNVPVVMVINVPEFGEDISMTAKLIEVENGSILWLGNGSGSTGKWMGTLLGAGAGAAGGAVVAGDGNETTGAVIGGVVGGAAAYGLSPKQADKTNTIVKKMCADIPSRL